MDEDRTADTESPSLSPDVGELFEDLSDLTGSTPGTHEEVSEMKVLLAEAHQRGIIESDVRRLEATDAAEAFVGSVIFASPLLVEGGVFDIADHLVGFTVLGVPVFLLANTAFVVFMTYALLEWTGRNRDDTHVLFGILPLRVFMILSVSFLVAALLMTVWGRVGDWQPPAEALARINVIWTVGSLGGALGDILSDSDAGPSVADPAVDSRGPAQRRRNEDVAAAAQELSDGELVDAIHEQFDDLESTVAAQDRRAVQRIKVKATQATIDDAFGDRIRKYTTRDVAEAFVGSIFFSIPFLVEDGVYDVAAYFLSFRAGLFPVFFLLNAAFVVLMVGMLVYWAGPQDVEVTRPILGVVPRRLIGVSVVSFLTAAALMTMWGRVGDWQDPVVALARISVTWTVASFGAALGDILPGESSGDDINDDLDDLSDRTQEGIETLLDLD